VSIQAATRSIFSARLSKKDGDGEIEKNLIGWNRPIGGLRTEMSGTLPRSAGPGGGVQEHGAR
jgi:hypothetical protein